jgi:hypothetical protein
LPPKLTSTVGGVDYYLQEIRNVITTKEDVEKFWPGVRVEDIKTLTLDGGQACVIGAFAHLPEMSSSTSDIETGWSGSPMDGIITPIQEPVSIKTQDPALIAIPQEPADIAAGSDPTTMSMVSSRTTFINLAVKQKAILQPNFKFRQWLENEKKKTQSGEQESLVAIESQLPSLKGLGASVIDYVAELEKVEHRLLEFYSGCDQRYKRHHWDMQRAKHYEYQLLADRLLGIVGGSVGLLRDPLNTVWIGVGLAKYSTKSGLSALDSSFLSYFIKLVSIVL